MTLAKIAWKLLYNFLVLLNPRAADIISSGDALSNFNNNLSKFGEITTQVCDTMPHKSLILNYWLNDLWI